MNRVVLLTALALGAFGVGCGGDDDDPETPTACFGDAQAYLTALENAPERVLLQGETPISECIVDDQSGGELADLGSRLVAVANTLNRRAERDPEGDAAIQLGYLLGAVQDAAATTGGIHEDLLIRLDAAARFSDSGEAQPVELQRGLSAGYAAGQETG